MEFVKLAKMNCPHCGCDLDAMGEYADFTHYMPGTQQVCLEIDREASTRIDAIATQMGIANNGAQLTRVVVDGRESMRTTAGSWWREPDIY